MDLWHTVLVITFGLAVVGGISAGGILLARTQRDVRNWLVHVVAFALVIVVIGEITLIFGRGAGCFLRGGCTTDEVQGTFDTMAALVGTLIALLFAVLKGGGGGDDKS